MTRVAALDCGTNTLRLLVADIDLDAGELGYVERRTTIVRLGQDVDRTGVFAAAALERTFAALDGYVELIGRHDIDAVRFVATSAARDVANREVFVSGVRDRLGIDPEIISGDEEARLAYDGATRQLAGRSDIRAPWLVLDIGGGSTELVLADGAGPGIRGRSLDVGSVRITERHLSADPPSPDQILAALADIDAHLDTLTLPLVSAGTLVGVAGTITTLGAMVLDLPAYDRERVNLARLPSAEVRHAVDRVVAMSVEQRRALPFMDPDRADVIAGGALILTRVLDRVGLPALVVSARDILDGIAWSMA